MSREKGGISISREFCQQVRLDGGFMALAHLNNMIKNGKCSDCPNKTNECKEHVKDLIHKIFPSSRNK